MWWIITNVSVPQPQMILNEQIDCGISPRRLTEIIPTEIGHEKAQSVIDSITNSYAAEGQSSQNPMLGQQPGVGAPFPPPPFAFGGEKKSTMIVRRFEAMADEVIH